jgi:hypothetical protein
MTYNIHSDQLKVTQVLQICFPYTFFYFIGFFPHHTEYRRWKNCYGGLNVFYI